MTRKNPMRDRERHIFEAWVTPSVERTGFAKEGSSYVREVGQLVHSIDIQQWQPKRSDSSRFTLNCGVYMPGVWKTFTGFDESKGTGQTPRTISVRCGMLRPEKLDLWWTLTSTDAPDRDTTIGKELGSITSDFILPFLDRFPNESAVAEFLSQPRTKQDAQVQPQSESLCVVYAGIIWHQLGAVEKCRECMSRAAELAKGKRLEADVERFAKKFVC